MIPRALTIAGSDSGGGAGIQADLKTFAALGVHGMSAITSITAQNTVEVTMVYDLPVELIREQIRVVVRDIGVDAVKTGMLHTPEIIGAVASELRGISTPIVVDPVMIAKSGARLLREDAIKTLVEELIPLAYVITPNALEAEALSGIRIRDLESQKKAAKIISELGARGVVVKGGHIEGERAADVLYFEGEFRIYEAERIEARTTHGTGCTFASAIAAELAKRRSIFDAVENAKRFVTDAIKYGFQVGAGSGPVNPVGKLLRDAERFRVLEVMREAVRRIEKNRIFMEAIPECQMNLCMAIPGARDLEDVAGVPGRIVRHPDGPRASDHPWFSASRHVARALLKALEYDPEMRAAMNMRYNPKFIDAARRLGWIVSYYDRRLEPEDVKRIEGGTIPWGVGEAIKNAGGKVPDIVYHEGDWGKEPMIIIFGRDAFEVVEKAEKLLRVVLEEGEE
ncbi:MAG: bifunctional hydroxymethylpyrimidine kinase/phosphomethylpyrimidine kinase [Thaumarchaeota archaeon]|jgi:hydroxymethylpyrimidine/phosphomethylpyrimidine kinase|nr:bifunctional hydroxymethylpyrimidine kinase/phosphomethylpyrimidine kinase [Nitrososphaerota archaeon]MCL7386053.1 bifunctional hydroxymethylpyrimidine kinase/phosphomethylpyrimidine kinase [Candidatus Wolframiiraptor allenii]